jgi:LAO/AO transport system kinase
VAENITHWAAQVRAGEPRAISRAITAIENAEARAEDLLRELFPASGRAYVIGVTGAPGTGKSTLVDRLAAHYRARGKTVGIIAVDPSSPYTGGAVLGDRIRMQGHATDAGIFIRSMATRGFFGGLARATADAALVLDAAGKEIVLIETVGVGQDEIDVVRLAECTLVLVVPGLGDDVQNMKAGLMEVADIFVLNKAEREGADRVEQQLDAMLELAPVFRTGAHDGQGWKPPVIRTTAIEGKGIGELAEAIERFHELRERSGEQRAKIVEYWKHRLVLLMETQVIARALNGDGRRALESLALEVAERRKNPYTAVRELLSRAGLEPHEA